MLGRLKKATRSFHPIRERRTEAEALQSLARCAEESEEGRAAPTKPGEAAKSRLLNLPGIIMALLVWQGETLRWVVLGGLKNEQGAGDWSQCLRRVTEAEAEEREPGRPTHCFLLHGQDFG